MSSGLVAGLFAGNLIWRRSHELVDSLEREIQLVELLQIKLKQALPSVNFYRGEEHLHHFYSHLDHDIAAVSTLLIQMRGSELVSSRGEIAADLNQELSLLLQQAEQLLKQLEAARNRLALNPDDPVTLGAVRRLVLESSQLQAIRESEARLGQFRENHLASLAAARENEERSELLELAVPLFATLLASALGLAFAWRTSRTIVQPLSRLNDRIDQLRASGDLESEPLEQESHQPEEIRALTASFNGLVQRLRDVLAQLEALSLTDPLTQVGNRRRFDHALASEVVRHRRLGKELALLLLDLDHFKPFNDLYGHPQGDTCLTRLAEVLSGLFRRPGEIVCRIGGEEFVVLLPETGAEEALRQGERILVAVERLAIEHRANPPLDRVSVSVGVSCGRPGDALTGAHLVDAADRALYHCKLRLGRNAVALSEPFEGSLLSVRGGQGQEG